MKWTMLLAALLLGGLCLAAPQKTSVPPPLTILEVLSGKVAPLSVPLKALHPKWVCFEYAGADESELFLALASQGQVTTGATYYSKGQTITLAGEQYLIAYRQERPPVDLTIMMRPQTTVEVREPLTPETALRLALLNVKSTGGLIRIRPFNLKAELAAGNTAQQAMDQAAARERSMSNIHQLLVATQMYAQDHNQNMPPMDDLAAMKRVVAAPEQVWAHPVPGMAYAVNPQLSGIHLGQIDQPQAAVVIFDAAPWPDGTRTVGFLDGHVEQADETRWQELKAQGGF
ncbi:MAG TPA: hypothetical protein PK794_07860 [Armatimonadota bacterium]|nr:hypothetical protein [Armatimonadota bacterium]